MGLAFALFFGIMLTSVLSACESNDIDRNSGADWNTSFRISDTTNIILPDSVRPIASITGLSLIGDSVLVIPDSRNARIIVARSDGVATQVIGGAGQGPGQFSLLWDVATDEFGSIYAFDMDGYQLHRYDIDEHRYEYLNTRSLERNMISMVIWNENIITLSNSSTNLLTTYTLEGFQVDEKLPAPDNAYSIYAARFNIGGIAIVGTDLLGVVAPGIDGVVLLNIGTTEPPTYIDSPIFDLPKRATLPYGLTPYDNTPQHEDWWSAQRHIRSIVRISESKYGVISFESTGLDIHDQRLHVFDSYSNTFIKSIIIPDDIDIVHGTRDGVFATSNESCVNDVDLCNLIIKFVYVDDR